MLISSSSSKDCNSVLHLKFILSLQKNFTLKDSLSQTEYSAIKIKRSPKLCSFSSGYLNCVKTKVFYLQFL